ncbi:hypothetical protein D0869_11385 [Hortaea werneckii]|uniref:Uncharacterized protein n=1 Tax=Hortaea werneckii TaxID=91943 RepID=A0A3M7BED6_HORWE|nr:hypothetical protein KC334_g371 [Hortaea werneckii]KAI7003118.1 hypothetical protein KC355_g9396 [Hortaea werneckii]KAI7205179.1 hypothetical protein KC324_g435 [Hortaea werneckii]KAI7595631.1 hypothetical protein KC316_g403 [Hortaea werneckii]KAI7676272.1 hypothetical protein KC318_g368 [Hortaea werneckii]
MPHDVYRWEEGGGLIHHCPKCKRPLTHDAVRSQCLGQHVEWCKRYHTQLFMIGWSSECAPCRHSEEHHHQRHRKIAELLRQLQEVQSADTPKRPTADLLPGQDTSTPSPLSKKERKAAKKAAKVAGMAKVVTAAEITFVAEILHPTCCTNDDAEDENSFVEDFDIKFNLYYHKGTTNTREARSRHMDNKQRKKSEPNIEESEIDAFMAALRIPTTGFDGKDQQNLTREIRDAVRDDLTRVAKEDEQTAVRKAGFWRWASKKTYDRHVANEKARAQKDDTEMLKRKDSADPVVEAGDVQEVEEKVPQEMENTGSVAESADASDVSSARTTEARGHAVQANGPSRSATQNEENLDSNEAEWTTVGKLKLSAKSDKTQSPTTLKLAGNGGLGKLDQTLSPTTLKLAGNGGLKRLQGKASGYGAIAFPGGDDE